MSSTHITLRLRACSQRRAPVGHWRSLHHSSPRPASVLFALSSLSNARETQHFNKLSRLPRVEHSPPLQLIKTSEIDPHIRTTEPAVSAVPATSAAAASSAPLRQQSEHPIPKAFSKRSSAAVNDARALQVGRAILADQAKHLARLEHALHEEKQRWAKRDDELSRVLGIADANVRLANRQTSRARFVTVGCILAIVALAGWHFEKGEMSRKSNDSTDEAQRPPADIPYMIESRTEPIFPDAKPSPLRTTAPNPPRKTSSWEQLFWSR